ncbi:hypothetical protein Tco_1528848, partial [Tanacetum coccineum]
ESHSDAIQTGADLDRCRFRQIQIHIQTRANRCIAQNHINTEMNESKTGRQQQRTTTDSDRQQTEQQIQTTDSDSRFRLRRTEPNKRGKTRQYPMQNWVKPDETRRIQSHM